MTHGPRIDGFIKKCNQTLGLGFQTHLNQVGLNTFPFNTYKTGVFYFICMGVMAKICAGKYRPSDEI